MIIFFIPLSVILLLILAGVALARELINSFLEMLPIAIAVVALFVVLWGIYRMVSRFKRGNPECRAMYSLGIWIMILSTTVGLLAFIGPIELDRCGRWFTWFGDSVEVQLLTYVCAVILIGSALMTIAYLIPINWVSNLILLVPIILPFAIYINAISVSARSYSDFVTTDFTSEDTLTEYEVVRDTKIYYPSVKDLLIPMFLPVKYTPEKFEAGEIVYAVYSSGSIADSEEGSYVIVSNGTIGGKVLVDDLKDVAEPQYCYEITLSAEQSEIYEAVKVLQSLEIYEKGDAIVGTLTKDDVPDGKLSVTGGDDGYLEIELEDGSLGYILRSDVEVVRIPLAEEN